MLASRIRVSAIAALVILGAAALAFGEGADSTPAPRKVNINTASAAELAYLPRIGMKVAEVTAWASDHRTAVIVGAVVALIVIWWATNPRV